MDECPQCGSKDLETRRESDGNNYSYDHRCRTCGHISSEPAGLTLSVMLSHADDAPLAVAWRELGRVAISPLISGRDFETYWGQRGRYYRGNPNTPAQVSFDDAVEFAGTAGATLPTLAELEGAADAREWTADGPTHTESPDPDDDVAAFRLVKRQLAPVVIGDPVGERLLEAIVADPRSDAARSVYADHLQQRGDPRGELIALQLARSAGGPITDREGELWNRHRFEWLGTLAAVVCPATLQFERGFLRACRIVDSPAVAMTRGDRAWWTVEEIDCEDADVLADPALRSLRRVAASARALEALTFKSQQLAIDTLAPHLRTHNGRVVRYGIAYDDDLRQWQQIIASSTFAHVRAIAIATRYSGDAHVIRKLLASPLGSRLTSIDIHAFGAYALDAWLPAMRSSLLSRLSVRQSARGWNLDPIGATITVLRRGDRFEASCAFEDWRRDAVSDDFVGTLAALARAGISRLSITAPAGSDPHELRQLGSGFAKVDVQAG